MEEERSQVIGGALGLIISQFIYDLSPKLYLIGYFILIIVGIFFSSLLKNTQNEDVMKSIDVNKKIDKKIKNNTVIVTSLFAILVGFWCMGLSGFEELAPLISNKIGYLESVYTILEIFLLVVITGSILKKINKKGKLLFTETVIACIDVFCLLIVSVTLSWKFLLIAYIISTLTSTLGDPIWGSIMSAYSTCDRAKWVIVNRIYFVIRSIFTLLTWYVCRECIIRGVESFKYFSIILIVIIIIIYIFANKINKKVFGHSI